MVIVSPGGGYGDGKVFGHDGLRHWSYLCFISTTVELLDIV